MKLYLTAEQEERVVRWVFVGSVVFFLFAASVVTPGNHTDNENKRKHQHQANISAKGTMSDLAREAQLEEDNLFGLFHRATFAKLSDEHLTFQERHEALAMLHGETDAVRKPRCGGWISNIQPLVLRFLGKRCPPLELIHI